MAGRTLKSNYLLQSVEHWTEMKHTVENLKDADNMAFLQCEQALIVKANKIRDEQLTSDNSRLPNPMLSASYVSASFEKGKDLEFEDYMANAATSYRSKGNDKRYQEGCFNSRWVILGEVAKSW